MMSFTLSIIGAAGIVLTCGHFSLNPAGITGSGGTAAGNPVIAQQYGEYDPHGDDPHGYDPHDEAHDPKLPSNAREKERRATPNVYDDVYNDQKPDTSLPKRQ